MDCSRVNALETSQAFDIVQMSSLPQKPTTPVISTPAPVPATVSTVFPTSANITGIESSFPTAMGDDAFAGAGTSFPTDGGLDDAITPDSTFNCPPASFVGCTAPNPDDPQDECTTVGQMCENGLEGEYCCQDGCPRNYCTAKEWIGDDAFQTTPAPTAPSFPCDLPPEERAAQLTNIIAEVSAEADLNTAPSPQFLALNWLLNEDLDQLCPSSITEEREAIIQRYVLALFYYSTNGNDPVSNPTWTECTAPSSFETASISAANDACTLTTANSTQIFPDDLRGSNAWLTPGSECEWGAVSW